MSLPEFKEIFENKLKTRTGFELLEYHYLWYSFGSGLLAYRINGFNYRLIFDGKEKELTVERSDAHEKYYGKPGKKIFSQWTLDVDGIVDVILK